MTLTSPFLRKTLDNDIKIFIVQDHFLENDLVIKLKNYGSVIDHHFNIMGFQHLLEHCFFFKNDDYNLSTNAGTSFADMNIEISFQDKKVSVNNPTLLMIKKWFFKNNDFTKIDFSRDLTLDQVKNYINELENESIYRDLLSLHWGLQNFFISDKNYCYFGGSERSFFNKEHEIIKFLKEPYPIPTEDINIYLRMSSRSFYNELSKIFSNIKKIPRKDLTFSYNKENFFNKVVQINNSGINELVFIFDKDLISLIDLVKLTFLFNNFSFCENIYIKEYYLSFTYYSINDLCQIILTLENSPELFLKYYLTNNEILDTVLYYEMFEIISGDLLKYLDRNRFISKIEFYKEEKTLIDNFIVLLRRSVIKKEYVIGTKIDNFYKYQTIANEPFNILDINFNFKNFYNVVSISDNTLWKTNLESKCNRSNKITSVNLQKGEIINNKFQYINKNRILSGSNKPSIYFYFESLILYFSTPYFQSLKSVIDGFYRDQYIYNILKIQPNNNIILSNLTYTIQTEYSFLFSCFQIPKKFLNLIEDYRVNLTHRLKKMGLVYHLEMTNVKFDKKVLVFYYTSGHNSSFDKIINYIKSSFISNNIPFTYNIVKSEVSFVNNISSIKKNIVMKC